MLAVGVEDEELQDAHRLDELDYEYMDDEFLGDSESSLLRESDESKKDTKDVGTLYLICLAISTGGYLISLVWLVGPLSGTIVQPYIGILSDRSQHHLGRRRPFIIIGTVAIIICILALPWTTDLITYLFTLFGGSPFTRGAVICKGCMAASWIWALNIAIQPVQGGLRAIIVDCVPPKQQVRAYAYASSAAGIGSILGYTAGYISLPKYLPWLGDTQLKGLCLIASVALGLTVAITCFVAKEKRFVDLDSSLKRQSLLGTFHEIEYTPISKKATPPLTFPTTSTPHSIRHATFIMILFALVALISNLTLPLLISPSSSSFKHQKPTFLSHLQIKSLTLSRVWTLSHLLTTLLTLSTLLTPTFISTSILIIFLGISWAITSWIPLALISTQISRSKSYFTPSVPLSPIPHPTSPSHKRNKNKEPLQAGTIMGLYNIAIALPQIIAAIQGSLVFWVLGEVGVVGTEAMGWVIRLGCLGSMIAAWLADSL
ncbi:hypothetical protein SBOR_2413 [Sclerotinia borealis F-4128]|uniref:MFS general substrate transporter n=1 Tax=Sclerotinia borealis (strain F-4128) TaxID=1432307 RepID=W9CRK2_SCLBF|nr:hypothetical protein SBOR_2413 [Sclerotinia borealis F-4128]